MGLLATVRAWSRRRKVVAASILAALLLLAGGLAWLLFAPKPSTMVAQARPDGEVVRRGSFEGADGFHYARGTVEVLRVGDGHALRFEGYDARAGPDVYLWLLPTADARGADAEAVGTKVLVPGGFMGGQATLRGDFNVPLPAGFDPAGFASLVAWCDRYDQLFGLALLGEPDGRS